MECNDLDGEICGEAIVSAGPEIKCDGTLEFYTSRRGKRIKHIRRINHKYRQNTRTKFYFFRNRHAKNIEIEWIRTRGTCCWELSNNFNYFEEISIGQNS